MRQSTDRKKVWRGLAPAPQRYYYDEKGVLQALSFRQRQTLGLIQSLDDKQREAFRAACDALKSGASHDEMKRVMAAGWNAA